jgi:hypothetical protein
MNSTLTLPVYIFETFFVCFVFSTCLFFPFRLTSLLSISSHPSILNITTAIITSQKILNCTQHRANNTTKGNDGKTEKKGKPASPQQKISTRTRGK